MFGLLLGFGGAIEHLGDVSSQDCDASIWPYTVFDAHGFQDPDLCSAYLALSQGLDLFKREEGVSHNLRLRIGRSCVQPKHQPFAAQLLRVASRCLHPGLHLQTSL